MRDGFGHGTYRSLPCRVQKVYDFWEDYRRGRVKRSHIVRHLGVQNGSWIIPILRHFEHLM